MRNARDSPLHFEASSHKGLSLSRPGALWHHAGLEEDEPARTQSPTPSEDFDFQCASQSKHHKTSMGQASHIRPPGCLSDQLEEQSARLPRVSTRWHSVTRRIQEETRNPWHLPFRFVAQIRPSRGKFGPSVQRISSLTATFELKGNFPEVCESPHGRYPQDTKVE